MSTVLFVNEWPVEGGPDGIAVSPDGKVFVNINQNHRVLKYSAKGALLAEWSIPGESSGIAVGPNGEVYVNINQNHRVVQYGVNGAISVNINQNHRVLKYSAEGELLAEWPSVDGASGLAVNRGGEVFVNINQNYRVVEYGANGEISVNINQNHRVAQYSTEGELLAEWRAEDGAGGLAVSPDGTVFSVNNLLHVVRCSPAGEPLAEWSVVAGIIETNGIVINPNGEVFVNINQNHRVVKYSPDGQLLAEWGGEGDQPGEFRLPVGVAIGLDGLVYVADKGNCRIQVFRCF